MGMRALLLLLLSLSLAVAATAAAAALVPPSTAAAPGVGSSSVLVALLDSQYTELAELVDKAQLLPPLERAVGTHNVTILAPGNEPLDGGLDPELRRFLLAPRNLRSLQALLLSHVLPSRLPAASLSQPFPTLAGEPLDLLAAAAAVTRPDAVVRADGVIHGVDRVLVPRSVQDAFSRRRGLAAVSAVLPTGAPEVSRFRLPPPRLDSFPRLPASSSSTPAISPASPRHSGDLPCLPAPLRRSPLPARLMAPKRKRQTEDVWEYESEDESEEEAPILLASLATACLISFPHYLRIGQGKCR